MWKMEEETLVVASMLINGFVVVVNHPRYRIFDLLVRLLLWSFKLVRREYPFVNQGV